MERKRMGKEENETGMRPAKEMLRLMKAADKAGTMLETILEEFVRRPFSMPALWVCREYFHKLGREEWESNPVLLTHLSLIAAMEGRLDEAEKYIGSMGHTPKHWKAEEVSYHDFCRISAELVMPYTSDGMFLRIVFFLLESGSLPMKNLTLSACRPSILNGFRDFTRYGRYLGRYKASITEAIQRLYGSGGKSVYEILLAEWHYQNNECFEALVLATGTIPLIEQEKDMRCLFAALALQMKILLVNGQTKAAKPLVEKIRTRIQQTGWEELTTSLDALECLAACYDGRREAVEQWLENSAPDENKDICMMDMYAYLVKVRCYIQTGKYMAAHVLVKLLLSLLQQGNRYMDLCECYMLSAIICRKAGDRERMCGELGKALEIARKYKYIRLLADEGSCMAGMLILYQQKKGRDDFVSLIIGLAGEVGGHFPDYLKSPVEYYEPLTASEKTILCLIAQGMSNDEIADQLGKKTGTVKFHSNNIFRKLRVQNRQQAVNRGREIGLL